MATTGTPAPTTRPYEFVLMDPTRTPKRGERIEAYGAEVAYRSTRNYPNDQAALAAARIAEQAQGGKVLVTAYGRGGVRRRVTTR